MPNASEGVISIARNSNFPVIGYLSSRLVRDVDEGHGSDAGAGVAEGARTSTSHCNKKHPRVVKFYV